ncbi:hypothetical protein [Bathycoccus sp. RCC716 virus 1]|uniref:Uncharacterized protein n=1 Tax=Bathycoccus sp. RCC716 virus 1 TaxID=2530038 RepID=A0A7S6P1Q8_9PHYC|nr:hypothetical protein [Bathycoccus sp. RCC716 virus 1]
MINFSEIQPGDLVRVLVNLEDIEDEMYAKVKENNEDYLVVSYYSETSMMYKGARIHEYEDDKDELVQIDNLSEHHQTQDYFLNVKDNLYVMIDDIDSDEESEIYDESDDDGSDLDDFIVPDNQVDGMVIPPSNKDTIDKEWNEWEPRSPGSIRFKQTVNAIETYAKIQADELNF